MWTKVKEFLTPPVFEDEEQNRKGWLLYNWIQVALFLSFAFFIVSLALDPSFALHLMLLSLVVIMLVCLFLCRSGRLLQATYVLLISAWLIVSLCLLSSAGFHAAGFSFYILIVLAAAVLLGKQPSFTFALASVIFGLVWVVLESMGKIPSGLVSPLRSWTFEAVALIFASELISGGLTSLGLKADHQRHEKELLIKKQQDLLKAYDDTIEGWSHALELRERETGGHGQRVVDLTLQLAASLGVSEDQMPVIRRGALLHDIGKMGIPDSILLKPGQLSPEEWTVMRQHPTYSYDLLKKIEFLSSSLDIPYCHHERWDGNGYPRGLKGEDIPLSARIFAVVDVWDALRSDKPYRPAWDETKVREYIRSLAGTYFDPKVVEAFLNLQK